MNPRYISQDTAKCMGNPESQQCDSCLRKLLPVHPKSVRQVWCGVWIAKTPCPSYWADESTTDSEGGEV